MIQHLRTADRFPVGDPRREAAQRQAARAVAAYPGTSSHPALAPMAQQLDRWSRFAPYLLTDAAEQALAQTNRRIVAEQLAALQRLDADPATALDASDAALRGLDADDPAARSAADVAAHRVTDRRAPAAAAVLGALAACHLADDAQRGIDDWRTRFAFVQGTTPATLATLRDAVRGTAQLAGKWWQLRAPLVGGEYADRRVGLPAPHAALAEHTAAAAAGIGWACPPLSSAAAAAAARVVPGSDNQVVIEADGRISATVAHRPTPRGSLMVAHETGHAVHALVAQSPEPPGALVGETVACWSSLVTGRRAAPSSAALALALGDTLVEELFVSAAVSTFEDSVYRLAADGQVTVATLDDAWLAAHRSLWNGVVDVPAHVASGWARLPALATDPGHAFSYVWATVLALAIERRHLYDDSGVVRAAFEAGGIDADQFTQLLGFVGNEWIDEGCERLAEVLRDAGQVAGSA